jgi:DNA-binding transcriptional MocR family regulator
VITSGAGYHQVAEALRDEITSGRRRPGDRMPSENDIVQQWGVSKTTARRAIRELRIDGLIEVRHGYPTRVAVEVERVEVRIQRGSSLVVRPPRGGERQSLGLGSGERVVEITYGARTTTYGADRHRFTFA